MDSMTSIHMIYHYHKYSWGHDPWTGTIYGRSTKDGGGEKGACPFLLNPFPNKPWILCSTYHLKTLWKKEKLLVVSNFSFPTVFSTCFGEPSAIFVNLNWSSTNPFNLKESKICCVGKDDLNTNLNSLQHVIKRKGNKRTACRCQHSAVGCLIQDKKSKSKRGLTFKKKNAFWIVSLDIMDCSLDSEHILRALSSVITDITKCQKTLILKRGIILENMHFQLSPLIV